MFTIILNALVHVNLIDQNTKQPLNDVVVSIVTSTETIQTTSEDGVASFDDFKLPLNERVVLTVDDSAFEPFFQEFVVKSKVSGTVQLIPKRVLGIQYVLRDNTPIDEMIVYVLRDIELVGRGVTNEDGFVSIYLRDDIYPDDELTIYMADPYEILEENVMTIDAPYDS